jgi:serine/threonine protein kinase
MKIMKIGTGSFGRVRVVRDLQTKEFYALKILKKVQILKFKQVLEYEEIYC